MGKIIQAIFGKREKIIYQGSLGRCVQIGSFFHVEAWGEIKGFSCADDAYNFLQGV